MRDEAWEAVRAQITWGQLGHAKAFGFCSSWDAKC